jgi:hypothetical protein
LDISRACLWGVLPQTLLPAKRVKHTKKEILFRVLSRVWRAILGAVRSRTDSVNTAFGEEVAKK